MINPPALTVITPISMDHAEKLGDTVEKIAFEKAGIMKRGVPCIVSRQQASISDVVAGASSARRRVHHCVG